MKYIIKINLHDIYNSTDWEEFDIEIFNDGLLVRPSVHGSYEASYIGWNCVEFKNQEEKEALMRLQIIKNIIQ